MSSADPQDFGILLNLAFSAFRDALDAELASAGFDDIGTSFGYVLRLLSESPRNLRELAQNLRMTAPGALKVVDDMVAKDYILRRQDEHDRRIKYLELTDRGRAVLERARHFHHEFEQTLVKRHGERAVSTTRRLLEAMADVPPDQGRRMPRPG